MYKADLKISTFKATSSGMKFQMQLVIMMVAGRGFAFIVMLQIFALVFQCIIIGSFHIFNIQYKLDLMD